MKRCYTLLLTISMTTLGLPAESSGQSFLEDAKAIDYYSNEKDTNNYYDYSNNDIPTLPTTRQVLQRLLDRLQSRDRPYTLHPAQQKDVNVDALAKRLSKTYEDFVSKRGPSSNCYSCCKSQAMCLIKCRMGRGQCGIGRKKI
ncbi:unnamed protein product [Owenia fusiformis]|uniref:Uncharacterized protein n=1 Tax=Owenia fusiformis TaxID=6347 RepID=A0A8S4PYC5_OWEFU|nr:unnamed protein product [Owenia fusiformis]